MAARRGPGAGGRRDRPAAPPDERLLHERALRYLARYAASRVHLRRVLLRRALRDGRDVGLEEGTIRRMVDAVVERVAAEGWLSDRAYAEMKARRFRAAGRPVARIRAALAGKGVGREEIETAIEALGAEVPDPDLAAAVAYARRRRLGPWREADERDEWRERDLARLARAGFGYATARRVIEAADADALEAGTED